MTMEQLVLATDLVRSNRKDGKKAVVKLVKDSPVPNLHDFHVVYIRISGGKDSQAQLDYVMEIADKQGYPRERIICTHADLGDRVEWDGVTDLVREQAAHYGLELIIVKRPQGDLLDQAVKNKTPGFPTRNTRWCTSDHKTSQQKKTFTASHAAWKKDPANKGKKYRVLECLGIRAEESPGRRKKEPLFLNMAKGFTVKSRDVVTWYPIHHWTVEDVWARIKQSGVRHHWAYDKGMKRLSCAFCIYAPKSALLIAAKYNPEKLEEYVKVERQLGHSFQTTEDADGNLVKLWIEDIQKEAQALAAEGKEVAESEDWVM